MTGIVLPSTIRYSEVGSSKYFFLIAQVDLSLFPGPEFLLETDLNPTGVYQVSRILGVGNSIPGDCGDNRRVQSF